MKGGEKMKKRLMRGFTMIELLIVIAVLGVLAVAVLSAINPIEQINRGRDTGSRSDAEQLLSAFDRYYTSQEKYPWQATADEDAALDFQMVDSTWIQTGGIDIVLEKLSGGNTTTGTEELKQSFTNRINNLDDIYKLRVHFTGVTSDSVYVCFLARSGSFKNEANRRCSATGLDEGDVDGGGLPDDLVDIAATVCVVEAPYICLP